MSDESVWGRWGRDAFLPKQTKQHKNSQPSGKPNAERIVDRMMREEVNRRANEYSEGSALTKQPGGDHYKKLRIQPIEYIQANGLGFHEGNVLKYITRWKDKDGLQDLRKAVHYLELLIEHTEKTEAALAADITGPRNANP